MRMIQDWHVISLVHADLDIRDFVYTRKLLKEAKPDVVINAVAFKCVDDREVEISRAFWVNAFAVRKLAQGCVDLDFVFVHISADYVFDDRKREPCTEDGVPNPLDVYGASRFTGEYFLRDILPQAFCHSYLGSLWGYGFAGQS